jgi:hypothetical protein
LKREAKEPCIVNHPILRHRRRSPRTWANLAFGAVALLGAAALSAPTPLQNALFDDELATHWIYDDFAKAKEEAATTGKPILALMRCVP